MPTTTTTNNTKMVNKSTGATIKSPWTNPKYPSVKGWTRVEHTRGPNDKQAGEHYYTYYPPNGNRIRSIVGANARMTADNASCKHNVDADEDVVIVEQKQKQKQRPHVVVDLTKCDDDDDDRSSNVYGNVTLLITSGGGYHIKWNE